MEGGQWRGRTLLPELGLSLLDRADEKVAKGACGQAVEASTDAWHRVWVVEWPNEQGGGLRAQSRAERYSMKSAATDLST